MTPDQKQELAHVLLIELLGYQFASPVKWIETQDVLVDDFQIEKLVEVGPQPILANMMKKTFAEKQLQMFSNGKPEISCFCVSDFNNIEYYESSPEKEKQDQLEKIAMEDKQEKVNNYNPFSKSFSSCSWATEEAFTYSDFVSIDTSKKIPGLNKEQNIDIELEKIVLKDLALNMAPKTDLLSEFVNVSNTNRELQKQILNCVEEKPISFFSENKIRIYDNSYNWIKEDIFSIALASNFKDVKEFTKIRISNMLKSNKVPERILKELDSILKYYNKSFDLLMQYFVMETKENNCYYNEPRCDSNVTLFDADDFNGSGVEMYELIGESLIPIDIQYENNVSSHGKNQCYMIIIESLNEEVLDMIKEWLMKDNNVICCFKYDIVENIYPISSKLQDIYKKHSSFLSSLRLMPMNCQNDISPIIELIYNKIGFDISAILNLSRNVDLFELSTKISNKKSNLSYITPPTTIISEYYNLKSFIDLTKINQENVCHIQFESLSLKLKDLIFFTDFKKCLKLTLTDLLYNSLENPEFKNSLTNDKSVTVSPLYEVSLEKPKYLSFSELSKSFNGDLLRENLSPENLVVITGFAELGPLGNASSRWDYEKNHNKFSIESVVYLSLIMGLIKYDSSISQFRDLKTNDIIDVANIQKYESYILANTGIRVIEENIVGYNPNKKRMLQEIVLMEDFKLVVPEETMLQFKLEHGDKVSIIPLYQNDGIEKMFEVTFNTGTKMYLPKALKFDRFVGGQIPTGWEPSYYGINEDIINQVDRVTLFALISTAEALMTSGIVDPYELYKYMHVSEVGNCSGSGIGGLKSEQKMQKTRFIDGDVQNDILQETFINVMSAWINMLLLSSSGPIKTPVGACATALESLDLGYETIMAGKATMVLVGGYDDLVEETCNEFAAMGATSNSEKENAAGRAPKEMCRPMTSSRNGFMESHGSGIQVLMRGDMAIKMGLPIFGVVGFTSMNSDKISKSLPAPGQGVLTVARKNSTKSYKSRKLDIKYRQRQLKKLDKQDTHSRRYWNVDYYKNDSNISPIEGALSVFGLTADDISVSTCHGTSTKANDKNETNIINTIMRNCNRKPGNLLPIVAQKSVTGHPKAAAGAWMINGALQMFKDTVIPGNSAADNVDINLTRDNEYLLFNKENITNFEAIKSVIVTCFGFGQKGSLAMIMNPNYLLATLSEKDCSNYLARFNMRYNTANSQYQQRLLRNTLFQEKHTKPFANMDDEEVYLDDTIRL